jgi:di/tricarboxylate transporter
MLSLIFFYFIHHGTAFAHEEGEVGRDEHGFFSGSVETAALFLIAGLFIAGALFVGQGFLERNSSRSLSAHHKMLVGSLLLVAGTLLLLAKTFL